LVLTTFVVVLVVIFIVIFIFIVVIVIVIVVIVVAIVVIVVVIAVVVVVVVLVIVLVIVVIILVVLVVATFLALTIIAAPFLPLPLAGGASAFVLLFLEGFTACLAIQIIGIDLAVQRQIHIRLVARPAYWQAFLPFQTGPRLSSAHGVVFVTTDSTARRPGSVLTLGTHRGTRARCLARL
jgi:hypothetical protein